MIKIAVSGATGKMGRLLINNISKSHDMQLVAAIVANMDKGAHLDPNIPVTDAKNADTMLEKLKPDVLIDFTTASYAVEIIKVSARSRNFTKLLNRRQCFLGFDSRGCKAFWGL